MNDSSSEFSDPLQPNLFLQGRKLRLYSMIWRVLSTLLQVISHFVNQHVLWEGLQATGGKITSILIIQVLIMSLYFVNQ